MKNATLIKCTCFFICITLYLQASAQIIPSWNFVGPVQFPTNVSGQINGIGRVSQLKFHPSDGSTLYAVAAHSLWKSTDTANTWQPLTGVDALPSLTCASVCIDYTNDSIIYLGTGDANYYSNSLGIYKSTDGGNTFTAANTGIGTRLAVEILMSPADHNTLVAATNDGIWKSTDGGASWSEKIVGGTFSDMRYKANSGTNTIYAVTKTGGFYLSSDLGDTWTQITSVAPSTAGGGRIAVTTADSTVVYAGFIGSNSTTAGGIIFRSSDEGNTFSLMKRDSLPNIVGYNATSAGQGNYNFDMTASPTNANTVYVDAHLTWKSDDGGTTWTQTIGNWASYIHTDMHCMRFDPYDTTKLFNCNDGGVWLSKDRGYTWTPRSNGLGATEFYHTANSRLKKYLIQAGAQDNGGIYYNINTWYTNAGGDATTPYAFDNVSSDISYWTGSGKRKNIVTNASSVSYGLPFTASNSDFYSFSALSKSTAFVAHNSLVYRTTNLGASTPTWTKIDSAATTIMAIAVSPADSNLLYIVTKGSLGVGKIYRCDNAMAATPTFTQIGTTPNSTNYNASFALNNNVNAVCMSNGSHVFRSINKGVNWTEITGSLNTSINIQQLLADTSNRKEGIYLRSTSVYYKDTSMGDWIIYANALPSCSGLRGLDIYYDSSSNNLIRLATYGRGLWEVPAYDPPIDTIYAVADAYVRNGSYANTNYGTVDALVVKNDVNSGYSRETYLKFNLKHADANASTVNLQLNIAGANTGVGSISWAVYYVSDDSWTENGVTWNNKPTTTTLLATVPGQSSGVVNFPVTDQVMSELAGDKVLTLKVVSTVSGQTTDATFYSREDALLSNQPQLLFSNTPSLNAALMNVPKPVEARIYPNPASTEATIEFASETEKMIWISINDMSGRVVMWRNQRAFSGNNKIPVNTNMLAAGTYIVTIKDGQNTTPLKLIITK